MKNDFVTKGVTFNTTDPDQEALLKHAMKRKNFSAYIKRLIQRDLDGRHAAPVFAQQEAASAEESFQLDDDLMTTLF